MTTDSQPLSITATTTVEVPVEEAFRFFTEDIGSWWNPDHHIIEAPLSHMVFDPFVGGHVYDVGTDGSECRWSRVLVYDPPERVVFSWDIGPRWELEPDLSMTSEVEVRFVPDGPDRTRVELEHRHLDRHGTGWESLADGVDDAQGWPLYLERFATVAAGAEASAR